MAETPQVKKLKDRFEAAMAKDRFKEAAELLAQLEHHEPTNPRWSHRLGDLQRRLGSNVLAISAYERAVNRYARTGFLARAVAMAKTITGIDPSRSDVLARIQQDDARGLKPRSKLEPRPLVARVGPAVQAAMLTTVSVAHSPLPQAGELESLSIPESTYEPQSLIPPEPTHRLAPLNVPPLSEGPPAARQASVPPVVDGSISVPPPSLYPPALPHGLDEAAPALTPAADAAHDEIRFVDQDEPEVAFDLTEDELQVPATDASAASALPEPEPDFDRGAKSLAVLPLFALFADVPREALLTMARESELVELGEGQSVIRTGDPADSLYAIVEGSVRVIIPGLDHDVRHALREGEVFGEACLLTDEPRHADVVAAEQLTALRIPKDTIDALVRTHAEVGTVLMNLLTRRLLVNLIKTSPLFAALDMDTRREVARLFEIRKATSGTVLVEAKKRGDGLYIPLTGKLEVTRAGGSVHVLPAGTIVGQGTFLGQNAATYTVRTLGDTVMLRLAASRLMELLTQYPMVLEQLSMLGIDDALA